MAEHTPGTFAERLYPSTSFFLAVLLLIPALTVLFTPYSLQAGIIAGVVAYALVCAIFILTSRKVEVQDGVFNAGGVKIDVKHLGEIEVLDSQQLRVAIGRRLDARAYLCVSGWVHSGVRVTITDPDDNTPYWVVTSRKPKHLAAAIREAQGASTNAA
ncbi:DUF3093 domain-containing protein [Leucobacter chinensis]|uniref:DUF3093 domain-containing protein n=1 Tax=Leucobacter chinensis TaxID=2851010 RepID=UPI001C2336A3|nr:DUF3093 domain-containing protein [Leucobacter chinensis]